MHILKYSSISRIKKFISREKLKILSDEKGKIEREKVMESSICTLHEQNHVLPSKNGIPIIQDEMKRSAR